MDLEFSFPRAVPERVVLATLLFVYLSIAVLLAAPQTPQGYLPAAITSKEQQEANPQIGTSGSASSKTSNGGSSQSASIHDILPATTTTTVSCAPSGVAVDQASLCSVFVKDASSSPTTPTGSVLFSLAGGSTGVFGSGGVCGLGRDDAATASCSVTFTPSASGTATVDALYGGDPAHVTSSGQFSITVSGTLIPGTVFVPVHSTVAVVSCFPSSLTVSQPSTCTVSVTDTSSSPVTPSGIVLFTLNTTSSATGSLSYCGLGGVNSALSRCSITFTPSGSGTAFVDALYGGDAVHSVGSGEFTVTVTGTSGAPVDSTTTVVACSPASIAVGQSSTCTVSVTDNSATPTTPTGVVLFSLNGTSTATGSFPGIVCGLGAVNPSTSSCSIGFNPTGSGTGVVDAGYGGDTSHSISSGQFTVSVPVHPTTTTVSCSPASIAVTQASTCTVSVTDTSTTPVTPTGAVLFSLDPTSTAAGSYFSPVACGLGAVNSATASCSVTLIGFGSGTALVVADYGGDQVHSASANQFTATVSVHATTTVVVCSPSSIAVGQVSTCTVSVTDTSTTPVTPTGAVLFSLDRASTSTGSSPGGCGLGSVNPATASCSVNFTPSGSGTALAVLVYGGDQTHSPSSGRFTVTVPVHSTTTVVVCSPSSLAGGQSSSCTVSVTDTSTGSVTPSGDVLFSLNGTSTATGSFPGGGCGLAGVSSTTSRCGVTFASSGSGTALVVAVYGGDAVHAGSKGKFSVTVPVHSTKAVVACTPTSVSVGQASACTVYVIDTSPGPVAPSGSVLFSLNTTSTATGSFSGGGCGLGGINSTTSSCVSNFVPSGSGTALIVVLYGGDQVHAVSAGRFTVAVTGSAGAPVRPTVTVVSCLPSPIAVNQPSVCTVSVTDILAGPSTPGGIVLFALNTTSSATGSFGPVACGLGGINSATSTCSVSFNPSGSGTALVDAFYGGDTVHSVSSDQFSVTVTVHSTTTNVSCFPLSLAVNQQSTCTVSVTDTSATPTTPGGIVLFALNTTSSATGSFGPVACGLGGINSATSTCSVSFNPSGSGTALVDAFYGGDTVHSVSSGQFPVVVPVHRTTSVVFCVPSSLAVAQASTCSISVTDTSSAPVTPGGVVVFSLNTTSSATGSFSPTACGLSGVNSATSTCAVTFTPSSSGTALIIAVYGGDPVHSSSASLVIPPAVHPTATSVSCSPSAIVVSQSTSCTAFVKDTSTAAAASPPAGNVAFSNTSTAGGSFTSSPCTLANVNTTTSSCSVTFTPISSGTLIAGATYTPSDTIHSASKGTGNTVTVTLRTTSTTVTCSPSSVVIDQATSCTALVKDTSTAGTASAPAGTVAFINTGTTTGSFTGSPCTLASVNSTTSNCTVTFTATHTGTVITGATYTPSDTVHSGSTGTGNTVTATLRTTSTTVTCSPTTISVGQSTSCTAFVKDTSTPGTASAPDGTVAFTSTGSATASVRGSPCTLTSVNVTTSSCSVSFTPSTTGTIIASATFTPSDTVHSGSTGTGNTVTVGATRATTTTVSCSPIAILVSQATSCTATVKDTASGTSSGPGGTVGLSNTGTASGSFTGSPCTLVVVNSTTSSCSVTFTPTSSGTVVAQVSYTATDGVHGGSMGTSNTVTVTLRATSMSVTCSPSRIVVDQGTSCAAFVKDTSTAGTATAPAGTVAFTNTGTSTGSFTGSPCTLASVNSTTSTCSVTFTPTQTSTVIAGATYTSSDTVHSGSTGTGNTVTVNLRTTSTTVTCLPTAINVGQSTSCTAFVKDTSTGTASAPLGSVAFTNTGTAVGSFTGSPCTLASVNATTSSCPVTFTPISSGTVIASATYTPSNTVHGGSTGTGTTVTVTGGRSTTTKISCSPSSIVVSQTTSCTATVKDMASGTPSAPGGTVSFTNTGTASGSFTGSPCTLTAVNSTASSCSLTFTPTSSGTVTASATYTPIDGVHSGSTGTSSTVTVTLRTTSTTVTCSPSAIVVSQATSCTAFVKDTSATGTPHAPTGTVSFSLEASSTATGTFGSLTCTLAGTNSTTASCNDTFSGTESGSAIISGGYGGDLAHNGGTGTASVTVTAPLFDYLLSVTPTSGSVFPRSTFQATVTATLISGTAQPVALMLVVSPSPAVCHSSSGSSPCYRIAFSPSSIIPTLTGTTSILTIPFTSVVPPDTYTLTISGSPSGASSSSAVLTLTVKPPSVSPVGCGQNLLCSVQSNSTLSNIRFAGNTIHLEATGPSGHLGYANVTVPKSAVPHIDTLHVFVDNSKLSSSAVTITSNSTDYFIYFTFTFHSPVVIDIQLTSPSPVPPSPSPTIFGLDPTFFYEIVGTIVAIIAVVGAVAYRLSRKSTKATHLPKIS